VDSKAERDQLNLARVAVSEPCVCRCLV